MSSSILSVNSSARYEQSVTRAVANRLVEQLSADNNASVIERDLAAGMPFINEQWVTANFTDADQRTTEQQQVLTLSDHLIGELKQADHIVIASPIYNFGIPASLKAWIDQIARAKITFRYTSSGPVGLLENKRAYLVMASGGVTLGDPSDFASPYLRQALQFIGIDDITLIDANDEAAALSRIAATS